MFSGQSSSFLLNTDQLANSPCRVQFIFSKPYLSVLLPGIIAVIVREASKENSSFVCEEGGNLACRTAGISQLKNMICVGLGLALVSSGRSSGSLSNRVEQVLRLLNLKYQCWYILNLILVGCSQLHLYPHLFISI